MNKKVLVFLVICAMWAMACGSNPGGNTLKAPSLSPEALQEVGAFEAVDPGLAEIDAKSALERARAADFGREGDSGRRWQRFEAHIGAGDHSKFAARWHG